MFRRGYAVTYLNDEDEVSLKEDFKNQNENSILAGIICVQNGGAWQAYVLGFDFDAVRAAIGDTTDSSFSKIIMDIEMLKMDPPVGSDSIGTLTIERSAGGER